MSSDVSAKFTGDESLVTATPPLLETIQLYQFGFLSDFLDFFAPMELLWCDGFLLAAGASQLGPIVKMWVRQRRLQRSGLLKLVDCATSTTCAITHYCSAFGEAWHRLQANCFFGFVLSSSIVTSS